MFLRKIFYSKRGSVLKNSIHLSNKYLLGIYYVPDFFLGAREMAVNRTDKNDCPHGLEVSVGETAKKVKYTACGINAKEKIYHRIGGYEVLA